MTIDLTPATTVTHPLDLLTAAEIDAAREILAEAGLVSETTRFAHVTFEEPPKAELLGWRPGDAITRRATATLVDTATGDGTIATVDLTAGVLLTSRLIDRALEGQPAILDEEFERIEGWLLASAEWRAALERRGIDPGMVRAAPLSPGNFGRPEEAQRRMARVLGFLQLDAEDLMWGHPIDGLVAHVDLVTGEVFEVVDVEEYAVPAERSEWDAAPHGDGRARTDMKPIEIVQPDGPSFTVEGNLIRWADWEFRFGFDPREGLILHQLGFSDGGRVRPVIHRASVADMVVPYGDPQPARNWINYFDSAEYIYGRYTNSLELGCDCLGDITYFDATIADERGAPRTIPNAICLHEEDFGVLWKHSDMFNGMNETRRNRRLVISFFVTIGNYDYGFYWYLYLDGQIELEAKATGIVFTSAYPGDDYPYATEMAPGLGAPVHQHLFSARLDMAVDGHANAVDEVDVVRVPIGPDNPIGNGFAQRRTRLVTEGDAQRTADNLVDRHWLVTSTESTNRLGRPVGYALYPEGKPVLLADPSSAIAHRGAYATKHLWVTRHEDDERWPQGEVVNQSPASGEPHGLPRYVAGDDPIDGEDIVLWHTFGLTHFPRTEDWPVMPVDRTGFTLKPVGFFDRNPALDAPASTSDHCAAPTAGGAPAGAPCPHCSTGEGPCTCHH
ncbi:primary-amine oxidase [Microbacterium marinilacus]|uniref:Amine oxidase n=1 Tax=Microbacterium marinilacus TaxID=415209 RepID=A0ABP7BWW3_9MICO|nr:primary-amine oxidase [Microbacterium marinilacus]MBY0688216.1 primary-amine oxidase [Microbacterium marinilacus]